VQASFWLSVLFSCTFGAINAKGFAKGFLIHPQIHHGLSFLPFQSALDRALQDAVNLIPTELEHLGYALLAGRFQPLDRQGLKQGGEARSRFRPGQLDHFHPLLGALGTRRVGMQNGPILTGV
jgi:hypothetical protein